MLRALVLLLLTPLPLAAQGGLQLVETAPVETTLGSDALPETADVWLEMVAGARRSIDLAFFYASNHPEDPEQGRLEPVIRELERAAERGVRVRFLSDVKFHDTYPDTLDRLDAVEGIEVRLYDLRETTGGVLHAKYLVVDGREAYVGSANFDWRALEHIQELGVRVGIPAVVGAFSEVFAYDWALTGGEPYAARDPQGTPYPAAARLGADEVLVTPVFSPQGLLPGTAPWDLPVLIETIEAAEATVRVQLLSYGTTDREGRFFADLENALRAAAARGVQVQLLLADWGKRAHSIEGLQSLQALRNVEVRLATLPQASTGFIPFARVVHAKYLVVDGRRAWLGTSNWSRDYFHASRNVGLLVEGPAFAGQLDAYFRAGWESPYAATVDPGATYEPPRVGR